MSSSASPWPQTQDSRHPTHIRSSSPLSSSSPGLSSTSPVLVEHLSYLPSVKPSSSSNGVGLTRSHRGYSRSAPQLFSCFPHSSHRLASSPRTSCCPNCSRVYVKRQTPSRRASLTPCRQLTGSSPATAGVQCIPYATFVTLTSVIGQSSIPFRAFRPN